MKSYKGDQYGRVCVKCKEYKLFKDFHKHSRCWSGFNTVCKLCRKPLSRKHYEGTDQVYRMWSRCKSRSVEKGLDFNLELGDIIIPNVCPVFKTPWIKNDPDFTPSVDRIDPTKGYIKGNIQIISNKANRIKSNASVSDLEKVLEFMKTL